MIIKGKNKNGKMLIYDIDNVIKLEKLVLRTDWDKIETDEVNVHVNAREHGDKYYRLVIKLFNKTIKPNQWMEIEGFPEAFNEFTRKYSQENSKNRKIVKKFKSKLSDENKLILEVI